MKFTETKKRLVTRTIVARILFSITLIGNLHLSGATWQQIWTIFPYATVISLLIYWFHEYYWNKAQWSRRPRNNFFFTEGQPRTIVKSITWRVVITISNVLVPYFATGSWGSAAIYLGLATVINASVFYIQDRVWLLINWGQVVEE